MFGMFDLFGKDYREEFVQIYKLHATFRSATLQVLKDSQNLKEVDGETLAQNIQSYSMELYNEIEKTHIKMNYPDIGLDGKFTSTEKINKSTDATWNAIFALINNDFSKFKEIIEEGYPEFQLPRLEELLDEFTGKVFVYFKDYLASIGIKNRQHPRGGFLPLHYWGTPSEAKMQKPEIPKIRMGDFLEICECPNCDIEHPCSIETCDRHRYAFAVEESEFDDTREIILAMFATGEEEPIRMRDIVSYAWEGWVPADLDKVYEEWAEKNDPDWFKF